jgi:uncharacterized protein (UPF0335 family)
MSDIGHNNPPETDGTEVLNLAARNTLNSLVERIERLETDKKAISEDMKEVYSEAKATGFDVTILRKVIARRKLDVSKFNEMEELIDLYMSVLVG